MIDRYAVLRELDFERIAGTEGERRAIDVITGYLRKLGARYELEPFELYGFETGTGSISVDGERFDVLPFGLEESKVLDGELVHVENPDALQFTKGAYTDKIVCSYGFSRTLHESLQENEVKAYIAISNPHRKASNLAHRQKRYEDRIAVPSMTVAYDDGERLIRHAGSRVTVTVDQKVEKRTAHNIVVDLGETERDGNLTYLVGHYDSVARSHGATDNAAGTACLVGLVEHFLEHPPQRRLKVVFFSGEELGLLGSFAYVAAHEQEVKDEARLVMNLDVGGDPIGQDTFHVIGTHQILGYVAGLAREAGLVFRENLDLYSSDGIPFSVYEVPSVNISRGHGRGSYFIHTADDIARYASPEGLRTPYEAARLVLSRILGAELFPLRKEIDESFRDKLEKYLYRATVTKPELKWREKYRR